MLWPWGKKEMCDWVNDANWWENLREEASYAGDTNLATYDDPGRALPWRAREPFLAH